VAERPYSRLLLIAFSAATMAYAQTSKPCPPAPQPKNAQEAQMMETSSDKKGCWVRLKNKDGSDDGLGFESGENPAKNYEPIITQPPPLMEGRSSNSKRPKDLPKTPADPCAIESAETETFQQWVTYSQSINSPNLAVNLSKLAAAEVSLEKCRSDKIVGAWIMEIDRNPQAYLN
jgi:hypothetical protein